MASSAIKEIIRQLKKNEISIFEVPEVYITDPKLLAFERKKGLRKTGKRGFDVIANSFFVEETLIDLAGLKDEQDIYLTFDDFDTYTKYLNGDIYKDACYSHCPRSKIALPKRKIKKLTKRLSFIKDTIDKYSLAKEEKDNYEDITHEVDKYYYNGNFYVEEKWLDKSQNIVKEYRHQFRYFFDFVYFLNGDLSKANLILCDGLKNLIKWDEINFKDAKMRSTLCEKFGLNYETYKIKGTGLITFPSTEQNESDTALVLKQERDVVLEAAERGLTEADLAFDGKCQRVHYITDLHLVTRIKHFGCRSVEDIIYIIQKMVDNMTSVDASLLLIGGDVTSDFFIFKLFVKMLSKTLHLLERHTNVVFILGNHELWSFPDLKLAEIVEEYRAFLDKYNMYLLHNDILYKDDYSIDAINNTILHLIKYNELKEMDTTEIKERLKKARYVILGGMGFSGYNTNFNANDGVYQNIINREMEIKETRKFEDLYYQIRPILKNKNTIIFTHMPKSDWSKEEKYDEGFVYVSGHNHRNFFYDDGKYRVYADNQIGYHSENAYLKSFLIDSDYDIFSDYEDGIYNITGEEYSDFYRGKNMQVSFKMPVNILYMLKKKGYYCFIHKSMGGNFTILNGGARRTLGVTNIKYYYDNMDTMISILQKPIEDFTKFEEEIARAIKKIGGSGKIHGAIIDIDFYSHIYVNPIDLKITGYYAENMVDKVVYKSIPDLLAERCPKLFLNYVKLFKSNDEDTKALKQTTDVKVLPETYLDTDIYNASRELKKMQKLSSNILTFWYDDVLLKKKQIEYEKRKELASEIEVSDY